MTDIYHDNGAAFGRRTRYFRESPHGGIEWMYAVDHANGCRRWYGYGMAYQSGGTIPQLIAAGMDLTPLEYRTEFTDAGEQLVIPGCERDSEQSGAKQMDLF